MLQTIQCSTENRFINGKTICAVLLAAGSSTRMGSNKMLMRICDKTPVEWCVRAFSGIASEAVIAVSEASEAVARAAAEASPFPVKLVKGGSRRQDSVYNALLATNADIVAIHDCARCLVDPAVILRSVNSASEFGSGIASIPVTDTLRSSTDGEIVDRSILLAAQTPQSFDRRALLAAYGIAKGDFTDDAALFKAGGGRLFYTDGSANNRKLTTKADIPYFEFLLSRNRAEHLQANSAYEALHVKNTGVDMGSDGSMVMKHKIGYGEDTHRLAANRRLVLGGVEIPFGLGLLGHSDADVLIHAVIDAVLGACALGDIGQLFPDSDPAYAGISSILLAGRTAELVAKSGFLISNIDATIVAQQPKLAPYRDAMRRNLATAFGIPLQDMSVKFTTPEHTGPEGNLECITARAVALVMCRC